MIYALNFTIPKNTPQASPASDVLPIHPGVLKQLELYFPEGCAGLAGVRLLYWEHQLYPANPDSWFIGDNSLISFTEDVEINDPPFELQLEGYNLDDTYDHTPIIRVQITPLEKDLVTLLRRGQVGPTGAVVWAGA